MDRVRQLASEIVAREGGFVNDPADPGGATKYGVTLGALRSARMDPTGDGRIDVADVAALSRDQAVSFFIQRYFYGPHLDLLPVALQPGVFDMYVNAGANAIKILQRLITAQEPDLACDGLIGPRTLAAVRAAARARGEEQLAIAYALARRDYYYGLADARPSSRKYVRRRDGGKAGWILRAEEFLPQSLWLSAADHMARTRSWT